MTSAIPVGLRVACAVALSIATDATALETPMPSHELLKCYGIAKTGKNDCQAMTHACAGTSRVDADPASFVLLPAGTCEKIVAGSLTPKQ